jgi:ABC-type multidrug transport system ATPase subunit
VRSLDLRVEPGERVGLVGPNGSGKTTVLRCIAGTVAPSHGTISVGGHAAGTLDARRLVGASFAQERSFYFRLNGRTNLLFYARLRYDRKTAVRKVAALEEELELGDICSTRVDRCSTGMVQQLGFARALVGDPRVLVLDEPTRSLDADAVERLWGAIDSRPNTALVIATHREDDLARCGTRVDFPR